MKYEWGEKANIPQGTTVKVEALDKEGQGISILGKIVGKSDTTIIQSHIVKCTDGTIPSEVYAYECFSAPLSTIEILDSQTYRNLLLGVAEK